MACRDHLHENSDIRVIILLCKYETTNLLIYHNKKQFYNNSIKFLSFIFPLIRLLHFLEI